MRRVDEPPPILGIDAKRRHPPREQVFTPLEYSCCGLSEEDAEKEYGADDLEVYVSYLKPLEWATNKEEHNGTMHREDNVCYVKMICVISQNEKVVGLHYLGPNAGEVMQV